MWKNIIFYLVLVPLLTKCQIINRSPHFVPGSGDMSRFSLSENTAVGSPVYQLRGRICMQNTNFVQAFHSLHIFFTLNQLLRLTKIIEYC